MNNRKMIPVLITLFFILHTVFSCASAEEFTGPVPKEPLCLRLQGGFVGRVQGVQELVARAAGHHRHARAGAAAVQGDGVAHAEQAVLDAEKGDVPFHVFFIAALQGDRVQSPGLLQGGDVEKGEKVLSLFFRFGQLEILFCLFV